MQEDTDTLLFLPSAFERAFLGNSLLMWLVAIGTAAVVAAGLYAVRAALGGRLGALLRRLLGRFGDVVVQPLARTSSAFLLAVAVYFGTRPLTLPDELESVISVTVMLVVLLQCGIWAHRATMDGLRAWAAAAPHPPSPTAVAALTFVSGLAVWSIVLLLTLQNLGVEVGALLAGLGVGGIAAALALQTVLKDLFASVSIFTDRPFDIGDFIIVGDALGTVDKVGLRTTRIRSLGGEQIVFPNGELVESRIRNYKRMHRRRVVTRIGVVYGTAADAVERIPDLVRSAIEGVEGLTFDRAHFAAFGASSLEFEFVYYVESPDYNVYMDRQQAVNLTLLRRFEQERIRFALPARVLHVAGAEDGTAFRLAPVELRRTAPA